MLTINNLIGFGVGGGDLSFLNVLQSMGLTNGLKLCLDAGDIRSYDGTAQKWLDVSGGGYDFMLGSETGSPSTGDEPHFNGTAGGLSGEYFSTDGGDWFQYDTTQETWMQALGKSGAKHTLLLWVYLQPTGSNQYWFCTFNGAGFNGMEVEFGSASKTAMTCLNGSAHRLSPNTLVADNAMNNGVWHLIGLSVDEAGGSVSFYTRDGAYDPVSGGNFFSAAFGGSDGTASTSAPKMFRNVDVNNGIVPANSRLGGLMIWQGLTAMTQAQMADFWLRSRPRFGYPGIQAWHSGRKDSTFTLSNSDQTIAGATGDKGAFGLDFVSTTGKYYCEFVIDTPGAVAVGVASPLCPMSATNVYINASAWTCLANGTKGHNGSNSAYGTAYSAGNRMMMAIDLAAGKIWWGKGGTWFTNVGVGDPAAGTNAAFTDLVAHVAPFIALTTGTTSQVTAKFKSSDWLHTCPTGFTAWPTA